MSGSPKTAWREWLALLVVMAVSLGITAAVDRPTVNLNLTLLVVVLMTLAVVVARQDR